MLKLIFLGAAMPESGVPGPGVGSISVSLLLQLTKNNKPAKQA
jgi:hypothetical protein